MLSYLFHDAVTEAISIIVISILFGCIFFELISLFQNKKGSNKNLTILKTDNGTYLDFSPLNNDIDEIKVLRAVPWFLLHGSDKSRIRYFTTILTSLGVLGTFIGIMNGLSGIDKKLAGDTAQAFGAVKDLLGGMSTAFVTSIVGMVASLTLLLVISFCDKYKFRWYSDLLNYFSEHYRVETIGDYLKHLDANGQQKLIEKQIEVANKSQLASEALLHMGEKLGESADKFDADKIGLHISNSLDRIFKNEMVPVFKDIRSELSELKSIKQDNGQMIVETIKNEIINPLTEEIRNTSALVHQSTSAISKLNADLGDVSIRLGESISTIQVFQKDTLAQLNVFANDLRAVLFDFQSDTKNILVNVTESIKDAVDYSVEGMKSQQDAFNNSAEKAANTFKDLKGILVESLEQHAVLQKTLLNEVAGNFDGVINRSIEVFDNQNKVMTDVGENAAALIDTSRANLEVTINNIENTILSIKNVVEDELVIFRNDYQKSLGDFFVQQNSLLEETLGSQRDGLSNVFNELKSIFSDEYMKRKEISSELERNLVEMQQSVEVVSNLVQSVKMLDSAYVTTIEQAAKSIGRQVAGFEKQHQATQQVLNQFMQQVPEALNNYFNTANDNHVKFFAGMDEASTRIHQRLLQSAEYLVSAQINKQQFESEEI